MAFFPIRQPHLGLAFSSHAVRCVGLQRTCSPFSRWRISHLAEQAFTTPLLRPSCDAPHIDDVPAIRAYIERCLPPRRAQDDPVALSLPDLTAHIGLFRFQQWPLSQDEQQSLLRFRFDADLGIQTRGRLLYRTFVNRRHGRAFATSSTTVLALTVQEEIVAQYESICADLKLIPVHIGLTSLQVIELFRRDIAHVASDCEEVFGVYVAEDNFVFVAFVSGIPAFMRVKRYRQSEEISHTLSSDLLATIACYEEVHGCPPRSSIRPFFLLGIDAPERIIDLDRAGKLGVRPQGLCWAGAMRSQGQQERRNVQQTLPALSAVLAASGH
jgi:hypothetical protein